MRPRPKKQDDRIIGWHPVLEALNEGLDLARVLIQRDGTYLPASCPCCVCRIPSSGFPRTGWTDHQEELRIVAFASPITFTPRGIGPTGL